MPYTHPEMYIFYDALPDLEYISEQLTNDYGIIKLLFRPVGAWLLIFILHHNLRATPWANYFAPLELLYSVNYYSVDFNNMIIFWFSTKGAS